MNKGFGLNGILIAILIILTVGTAGAYVVKKTDLITEDTNDVTFVEENNENIPDKLEERSKVVTDVLEKTTDLSSNTTIPVTKDNNVEILNNIDETSILPSEILTVNTQEDVTNDYNYYKTIGFEGGILEVTDSNSPLYGLKIEIPEGALLENTNISAKLISVPENEVSFGDALFPQVDFGPEGTIFSVPIHITYLIKEETILNLGENSLDDMREFLSVYYFDEVSNIWKPVRIIEIDSVNNTVTYEIGGFY